MKDPTELEKIQAALAREQIALETARHEAQHWKNVAEKLGEQLAELKRSKK